MWKTVLAGTAAFVIVGSSLVYAQQRNGGQSRSRQFSPEDRAAFAAARVAALRAGLALNADQEKNWPAFESALKDLSKFRMEQRTARRNARPSDDPTERLRRAADALTGYGGALKKLADSQQPLYSGLDPAQKRRFTILARMMEHGHHGGHHGDRRDGRGEGRGEGRGMGPGMDQNMGPGMGRGTMQRGDLGPGMRGEGWRDRDWRGDGRREFGAWRDHRRFGRNDRDNDNDVPRLGKSAPATSGEGKSL